MGQVSNKTLFCWADILGCFAADNLIYSVPQARSAIHLATATSVTLQVVVQLYMSVAPQTQDTWLVI